MRVGLVLDNPRRDFSGIVLLAYHFLKRGDEVYIVPMYEQGYDVPLLGLDAIIVNYARTNNVELLRSYREMDIAVLVLDTEGGVFPQRGDGSPEFWARRFQSIGASEHVDRYLFWGERLRDAFAQYGGLSQERLILTGCPRYDLCDSRWRSILRHPRQGHILINLNFPSVNPWWGRVSYSKTDRKLSFSSADEEMRNASKIVNVGIDRINPLQQERIRALNEYVRVIAQIAERNPARTFVLRPHPFENTRPYEEVFAEYSNVVVDPAGEAAYVMASAELVLHLNCSTSIEARLLGKLPVALEFLNSDLLRFNVTLPTALSHPARSVDELDDIIKDSHRTARDRISAKDVHDIIYPWFYKCDGRSSERVVEATIEAIETRTCSRRRIRMDKAIRGSRVRFPLGSLAQGVLCQLLGSQAVTRGRTLIQRGRSVKYVSSAMVSRRLDELMRCEGTELQASVKSARHPISGFPLATLNLRSG